MSSVVFPPIAPNDFDSEDSDNLIDTYDRMLELLKTANIQRYNIEALNTDDEGITVTFILETNVGTFRGEEIPYDEFGNFSMRFAENLGPKLKDCITQALESIIVDINYYKRPHLIRRPTLPVIYLSQMPPLS